MDDFIIICDDSELANLEKNKNTPKLPIEERKRIGNLLDNFIENSLSKSGVKPLALAMGI